MPWGEIAPFAPEVASIGNVFCVKTALNAWFAWMLAMVYAPLFMTLPVTSEPLSSSEVSR
jgi:hypothetical protein